jgi:hypothetical protein
MSNFIDWLVGRKRMEHKEGVGLSLEIQTINELAG